MSLNVWFVNAFTSDLAGGNPTAVVLADSVDAPAFASTARLLRVPDTVFLLPEGHETWRGVFYSPLEGEIAFCGQGLLAAGVVLRRALKAPPGVLTVRTQTAAVQLRYDGNGRHWLSFPRERVWIADDAESAVTFFQLPEASFAHQRSIDSGRRRVFLRASTFEALAGLRLSPQRVLEYCERNGVSGICFYTVLSGSSVGLRVFTRSLAGDEDASTGGAVLGLSQVLDSKEWRIEQGIGSFLRRGTLFLRPGPTPAELELGGAMELTVEGALLR